MTNELEKIEGLTPAPSAPSDKPIRPDRFLYRAIVLFLGLTLTITVVGGIYLAAYTDSAIPDGIIALGSAAIGALAGLLSESPSSKS